MPDALCIFKSSDSLMKILLIELARTCQSYSREKVEKRRPEVNRFKKKLYPQAYWSKAEIQWAYRRLWSCSIAKLSLTSFDRKPFPPLNGPCNLVRMPGLVGLLWCYITMMQGKEMFKKSAASVLLNHASTSCSQTVVYSNQIWNWSFIALLFGLVLYSGMTQISN